MSRLWIAIWRGRGKVCEANSATRGRVEVGSAICCGRVVSLRNDEGIAMSERDYIHLCQLCHGNIYGEVYRVRGKSVIRDRKHPEIITGVGLLYGGYRHQPMCRGVQFDAKSRAAGDD